jgi:hypothetical protein
MPHQNKSSIIVNKQINPNLSYRIFKWYEIGYLGVGKTGKPFFDMTPWIDVDSDLAAEAKSEIDPLIGKFKTNWFPKNGAYVPEDINNKKWLNYFVWNIEKEIPEDVRLSFTAPIDLSNWIYSNELVLPDWNKMSYIMRPNASAWGADGHLENKKFNRDGEWVEDVPILKRWIESWNIFDNLGRIVVFENSVGNSVGIHRDTSFYPSLMHNISIQFTPNRPVFVYDEKNKEKIYFQTQAYCFNPSDNHGVDASENDLYTIRIDGVFKPHICEALGLVQGYIWSPHYKSAKKLEEIQIFEPDERP